MTRIRQWILGSAIGLAASFMAAVPALVHAQQQDLAPNAMVERVTTDVLTELRNNERVKAGDVAAATDAVDRIVMPNVNFQRMTAAAVGPAWRGATAEQREQLIEAFKGMLIRTYANSLEQVGDLRVVILPMRAQPADATDVLVRSEVRGGDSPVQLDYRLQKTPGEGLGWKVYNVNVMGAWIVDTYRPQFTQEINANGIDGLIRSLQNRNSANQPAAS
ncbi:ABC transporter substrate-binding protein [Corticibacter populi]|uniref:ABC transporter substrate-binding protein n=1 Tax=Corticibacter populi TaxID=1550736 RepID=A0A3M6QNK3_9BURK|nr:ABC transporter substrate-binding protein [Corticibacter populi]RMX04331.1 ABC transporter substrate-binding protein [Corticibacter populi]